MTGGSGHGHQQCRWDGSSEPRGVNQLSPGCPLGLSQVLGQECAAWTFKRAQRGSRLVEGSPARVLGRTQGRRVAGAQGQGLPEDKSQVGADSQWPRAHAGPRCGQGTEGLGRMSPAAHSWSVSQTCPPRCHLLPGPQAAARGRGQTCGLWEPQPPGTHSPPVRSGPLRPGAAALYHLPSARAVIL